MAGSLIFSLIIKLYNTVNLWYENSLIHKVIKKIAMYCENSLIINGLRYYITREETGWAEGSLLFIAINKIKTFFWHIAARLYDALKPFAQGSVLLKILSWDGFVLSLLNPVNALAAFVFIMSIVPAHYWNNAYSTAAAAILAVSYVFRELAIKNPSHRAKTIPASLLIYFLIMAANLMQSPAFSDSLRVAVIFFSCAVVGLLVQNIITSKKDLEFLLGAIFIGVFVTSFYGIYQYIAGIEIRADLVDLYTNPGLRRAYSTMGNPNNYAKYLILFLPFCVSYAFNRKTELGKFFAVCMLAPVFLALILTASRAAYLVAVGSAGLYVLLMNKRLVPFFILVFIACIPFIPTALVDRVLTIGMDSSSKYRLLIWDASFQALRDYWVLGVSMGPEAFSQVYRIYANETAINARHAHNLFMQIWIENGIFAFAAFMAFFVNIIKRLLCDKWNPKVLHNNYHIAAICSLVGFAMFGIVEYTWFYPRVMLSFWIVVGIALSLRHLRHMEAKSG